jgi:hypothetical protein
VVLVWLQQSVFIEKREEQVRCNAGFGSVGVAALLRNHFSNDLRLPHHTQVALLVDAATIDSQKLARRLDEGAHPTIGVFDDRPRIAPGDDWRP